ncbi:MAG: Uncharacterized protein Athens071425_475 [Parcubacteria group bacterium Athens0714_25]|nr:MAG: Uncharacterized protein Athens071425_475 [Parcubacteria group bacterium Athens0714_25]
MQDDFKKDGLENLKKRLYRKDEEIDDTKERVEFNRSRIDGPSLYWQNKMQSQGKPKLKKFFIWMSITMILVFAGVAAYFLLSGSNIISSKNINLEITGPSYIDAGSPVILNIFVENKNQADLETADLILNFPENSFSPDGSPLERTRISLGKIKSGESMNKTINLILFGLENEDKKISGSLEYRLAQSNAIFAKDVDYTVKILRPAIGLSIAMPGEINARQEIELSVDAVSNSESIVKNVFLSMSYPPGFQFASSDPMPSSGQNQWSLGDFASLQKKTITIKGLIEGQDTEEKTFNASVGILGENGAIIPYGTSFSSAVIRKNPLALTMFINGDDVQKNILKAGGTVRTVLRWQNNSSSPIRDVVIELALNGSAIDGNSLSVSKGNYRPSDQKLVWNSSTLGELAYIGVGQSGEAQFSFSIKNVLPIVSENDKNFSVSIDAQISGNSTNEQSQNFVVSTETKKIINILSGLNIEPSIFYRSGPFKNTGPLPPKINSETTYTVNLSLSGNSNDLSGVKIKVPLLPYVRWLNSFSPSGENLSFNDRDGTVVWTIDKLLSGTGIISPKKEVSFQIGFTPSVSQENSSPILVGDGEVSAFDDFIKDYFNATIHSLNTVLSSDQGFKSSEGHVVK